MSLYKDASLVMIPSAYKDGKLYSIRPVPEYGAELVTNGTFDTDSDWTLGTGWSIANGKLTANNASGYALQSGVFESGVSKTYRISFSVSDYVSGYFTILTSGGTSQSQEFNANGNYTIDFNSNSPSGTTLHFTYFGSFSGSIDNVSVQEIVSSGDFTFSRGSNLAATRVDVNGLIEKGRENLLLQSNQFDTGWSNGSSNEASGFAGYDGSNNAWKVTKIGAAGFIRQELSSSGVQTFSVYVKAADSDYVALYIASGTSASVWFNLINGTTDSVNNAITSNIESAGDGWYRCSLTANLSLTDVRIYPAEANSGVSATSGSIYIQDAQLEQGLVATDYIEAGTSAAQSGILEDMPRLDYSGGASCPSLLLEPQRANLVTQSEYFGDSYWTKSGSSVVSGFTSPEGLNNAYKLVEDTSTGDKNIYTSSIFITNSTSYSVHHYIKAGEKEIVGIQDVINSQYWASIDLINGVVLDEKTSGSTKVEPLTNGYYKVSCSFTSNTTSIRPSIFLLPDSYTTGRPSDQDYTGDGTSGIYIYGAQLEQGSYPTSYIPTYGTSQTRSEDSMANLDIPDFNNNTSFSVLLELTRNGISSSEIGSMFSFYNDSSTQQFWFHIDAPNSQVRLRDATNSYATMATISFDTDDRKKIAFSCDGSTLKTYADGVLSNTYNLVNVFNVDELRTAAKSFDVHQILTFPTALTDSECIALTTL